MPDMTEAGNLRSDYQLGAIVKLLLSTPRKAFRIGALEPQVLPALDLNQACVLRDHRGVISGYALWAFVSDAVLAELIADPMRLLHRSEWNEGLNLVVTDFVAPAGRARSLARRLLSVELSGFDFAIGIRRDRAIPRIMRFRRRHP